MRKIVAITGGIGSGKSSVTQFVKDLGYKTIDCDQIAKQVADDKEILKNIKFLLGEQAVDGDKLNRKYVRSVVFKDANLLSNYNKIFADAVKTRLQEQVSDTKEDIFVEISVFDLFDFAFDEVWLVKASEETRISRVVCRDGTSEQNVKNIINSQHLPKNPTLTITNDGSLQELQSQVVLAIKNLSLAKTN